MRCERVTVAGKELECDLAIGIANGGGGCAAGGLDQVLPSHGAQKERVGVCDEKEGGLHHKGTRQLHQLHGEQRSSQYPR